MPNSPARAPISSAAKPVRDPPLLFVLVVAATETPFVPGDRLAEAREQVGHDAAPRQRALRDQLEQERQARHCRVVDVALMVDRSEEVVQGALALVRIG